MQRGERRGKGERTFLLLWDHLKPEGGGRISSGNTEEKANPPPSRPICIEGGKRSRDISRQRTETRLFLHHKEAGQYVTKSNLDLREEAHAEKASQPGEDQ